jgi:hypothetical protein
MFNYNVFLELKYIFSTKFFSLNTASCFRISDKVLLQELCSVV